MLFDFTVSKITIEASSEEAALSKISSRLSSIARHLGDEVPLADNAPFFTLAEVKNGTPADLSDPIVAARLTAEAEAAAREQAQNVGEMVVEPAIAAP